MIELVADGAAIQLAHVLHDVGGRAGQLRARVRIGERRRGNLGEVALGNSVKLWLELGGSERRCAEGVELNREMPVPLNSAEQGSSAGDLAQQRLVDDCRPTGTGE